MTLLLFFNNIQDILHVGGFFLHLIMLVVFYPFEPDFNDICIIIGTFFIFQYW